MTATRAQDGRGRADGYRMGSAGEKVSHGDEGGASRFFKVVEPDTAFREDLKSRTPRRSESNFDVATGRPLGPARLLGLLGDAA